MPPSSHRNEAKALRSWMAPRLGPLLRLQTILTARLWSSLDESWGQRHRDNEERLTADIFALARQYGRYGYRKISGLLEQAGWAVNDKWVGRIWRREGLKVPHKQPKRGRLWLADGSRIRLRPEHRNHVWSYDFVEAVLQKALKSTDPLRRPIL